MWVSGWVKMSEINIAGKEIKNSNKKTIIKMSLGCLVNECGE